MNDQIMFFFFNDTATTEIYTLSLHDALPISDPAMPRGTTAYHSRAALRLFDAVPSQLCISDPAIRRLNLMALVDRKSTRLNSSHANISYAVFCLKKKMF